MVELEYLTFEYFCWDYDDETALKMKSESEVDTETHSVSTGIRQDCSRIDDVLYVQYDNTCADMDFEIFIR